MHDRIRWTATLLTVFGSLATGCADNSGEVVSQDGGQSMQVTGDASVHEGADGGHSTITFIADAGIPTNVDADPTMDDATTDDAGTPDAMSSTDAADGNMQVGGGGVPPSDAVPAFDSATDAHVRDLVARGAAAGNNHAVVAKIGDSISESGSFLQDCGNGWYNMNGNADLQNALNYFTMVQFSDGRNRLSRASLCAVAGWSADEAIAGCPASSCPLSSELDAIHPQWAIVMYGTNDLERFNGDVGTFMTNMNTILDMIEARSAVAVLSTIPPRLDNATYGGYVPMFNDAIRNMAATRHLPLIDFWLALQSLPGDGIGDDGVHPNVYDDPNNLGSESCYLTPLGLQYGYNVRNYTALSILSRLMAY